MRAFSDAHFGRSSGHPGKWGALRLEFLRRDAEAVQKQFPDIIDASAIAAKLVNREEYTFTRGAYENDTLEDDTLAKYIGWSRNPSKNGFLRFPQAFPSEEVLDMRLDREKSGEPWTDDDEFLANAYILALLKLLESE